MLTLNLHNSIPKSECFIVMMFWGSPTLTNKKVFVTKLQAIPETREKMLCEQRHFLCVSYRTNAVCATLFATVPQEACTSIITKNTSIL